jgi:hypothetical protein
LKPGAQNGASVIVCRWKFAKRCSLDVRNLQKQATEGENRLRLASGAKPAASLCDVTEDAVIA